MKEVLASNGKTNPVVEYLAQERPLDRRPGDTRLADQGPVLAPRPDEAARGHRRGRDVPGRRPDQQRAGQELDFDTFLAAAEKCFKAGVPFGIGLGTTSDSVDSVGAVFNAFGAQLVDEKGEITVRSEATLQALDYMKRLSAFLPPDVIAWDDASNNRWLISGKGALIFNPPSAWAVAKRDAPKVAEQCWTHPMPAGPKGRFAPYLPFNWGIWSFSKNKSAAKSLLAHLSTKEAIAQFVEGSQGYDIPGYESVARVPGLGRAGAAQGHAAALPHRPGRADLLDRGVAGPAEDRRPGLQPGHRDQDGGPDDAERRYAREGGRLG